MSFASGAKLGFDADIAPWVGPAALGNGRAAEAWFSEEPGFVLEVDPAHLPELESWARALGAPLASLGTVDAAARWRLHTPGLEAVELTRAPLERAWSTALGAAFTLSTEVIA